MRADDDLPLCSINVHIQDEGKRPDGFGAKRLAPRDHSVVKIRHTLLLAAATLLIGAGLGAGAVAKWSGTSESATTVGQERPSDAVGGSTTSRQPSNSDVCMAMTGPAVVVLDATGSVVDEFTARQVREAASHLHLGASVATGDVAVALADMADAAAHIEAGDVLSDDSLYDHFATACAVS